MKKHLENNVSKKRIISTLQRQDAEIKCNVVSWTISYNNDCVTH